MHRNPLSGPGSSPGAHPNPQTIDIEAPDRAALFTEVARAFLTAVTTPEEVQPREARVLEQTADTLAGLLNAWVSELLLILSADKMLIERTRVVVDELDSGLRLQATVWGEPRSADRHRVPSEPVGVSVELLHPTPPLRVRLRLDWPQGGGS